MASKLGTESLRSLHCIHRQLTDLRSRLQRGPKQIDAGEAQVARCGQQLATVQNEAKELRMASDRKQLQLKTGENKVEELKRKLNTAESNREYQALKEQMAALEMTNSVLADEILEELEQIDQYDEKVAQAEAAVAKARENAENVRREVEQQQPLIEADLQRLGAELKEIEAGLPDDVRELYDRVVRQKGEDALAAVVNEYCSGCHQHVPINVCAELMMSRPVFCKTCGRLLYMAEQAEG